MAKPVRSTIALAGQGNGVFLQNIAGLRSPWQVRVMAFFSRTSLVCDRGNRVSLGFFSGKRSVETVVVYDIPSQRF
ncbi:MAG: hypothetical protein ACKO24_06970 [Leptolyngbyaceae cyanobacterium]